MIGEREKFDSETQYGSLTMRSYDIDGNKIDAFYDSSDNLIFVLDNTINSRKPNILLVINPEADKKWDEILSGDYGVDLETIRPKQDNKYQKFDIEYSGLSVYDALIKAFDTGDSLEESLNQLTILRDSAARHSAMTRLNTANEIIAKTNATIVKTKESIVRLQARLKTLRAKLSEAKKGIGREPTKQSASKILKLESQIEATNEKLKRANERLKSAQRRLETATVDAELASELLNQPSGEIRQTAKKQTVVAVPVERKVVSRKKKLESEPQKEDIENDDDEDEFMEIDDDSDEDSKEEKYTEEDTKEEIEQTDENYEEEETEKVEPLFKEDPQILNDDIAFKPISFEPPVVPEISQSDKDSDKNMVVTEKTTETTTQESFYEPDKEQASVLESMIPVPVVDETPVPVVNETTETIEEPWNELSQEHQEKPLELEPIENETRQFEPEVIEKTTETIETTENKTEDKIEENTKDEYIAVPPVIPVAPTMPRSILNVGVVEEAEPKKSRLFYYLLLILLIVLAVFALWLYQKNVKPSMPVLAASIEKTELPKEQNTVFKKISQKVKTSKQIKAPVTKKDKNVDIAPTFLDEPSVETPAPAPVENETLTVEEYTDRASTDTVPEVIDAVPARVTTSGQSAEQEDSSLSEEDILAAKPAYQPGSKYDEMFVADEGGEIISPVNTVDYVEEEVVVSVPAQEEKDTVEYVEEDSVHENDPFFDEEEAAYQAEQAGLYYEE